MSVETFSPEELDLLLGPWPSPANYTKEEVLDRIGRMVKIHTICEIGAYLDNGYGVELLLWKDMEEKLLISESLARFDREWPAKWLDIQGTLPKDVDTFPDISPPRTKLVEDPGDFYSLTKFDLLMAGTGEKTTERILKGIAESKSLPFSKVLFGLAIPNVGRTTAQQLAKRYRSLDNLGRATFQDLISNEGIGATVAMSVLNWFHHEENWKTVEKLRLGGVDYAFGYEYPKTNKEEVPVVTKVAGKEFMFTGRLSITRARAQLMVSEAGGYNGTSVRKDTDYLVVGEDPGEKVMKATALGIPMITEEEFFKMVKE